MVYGVGRCSVNLRSLERRYGQSLVFYLLVIMLVRACEQSRARDYNVMMIRSTCGIDFLVFVLV